MVIFLDARTVALLCNQNWPILWSFSSKLQNLRGRAVVKDSTYEKPLLH